MFQAPSVDWVGHRIDAEGVHPIQDKVEAVENVPEPTNVSELRSFLGLVNYYGKYLANLSSVLEPLNLLLRKDSPWSWGKRQKMAFQDVKTQLLASHVLVHFDPKKPLVLSCDASPYGVGAVLAHILEDGTERPIGYASRTLSSAERNYAQIDKEGLAVVFGVKKFNSYVYGRPFTIITDHKPLLGLFGELKAIPPMASGRIQRWALTLSAYDYTLVHKAGKDHGNADALSRLPVPTMHEETPVPEETVLLMSYFEKDAPVTADQVRQWTSRDSVLSRVYKFVQSGWPNHMDDNELKPYFRRRVELSLQDGCILWGSRVVIPPRGREAILEELHSSHPGASRMKSLARCYVWWPHLDDAIEERVKSCTECQMSRNTPQQAPMQPWEWPKRPWAQIHVDYAGPFMGQMFLVIVDAHSKWLEVLTVGATATAKRTIDKLRAVFATHGLPETIVSDNGSVFKCAEFEQFTRGNGIRHVFTAPYHPASNGLAERAVQSFKQAMKCMDGMDINTKLSQFLFKYRLTPHTSTGQSPSQLLMGRQLRSRLDLVNPDLEARVKRAQIRQAESHDVRTKQRDIEVGDQVYVKNFGTGPRWLAATVVEKRGSVSHTVQLEDGRVSQRHVDHLRRKYDPSADISEPAESELSPGIRQPVIPESQEVVAARVSEPMPQVETPANLSQERTADIKTPVPEVPVQESPVVRRSVRTRKTPQRLDL